MSGKLNFCLIGAGRMGERWAKILSNSSQARLSVIVEANRESAERVAKNFRIPFLERWNDRRIKKEKIDAVLIATPHKYLSVYTNKALRAGLHVLVEKPGATNLAEMEKNIRLARRKKLIFMVGFNYRFFDAILKARKFLSQKKIGRVNFIRLKHGHPGRAGCGQEWRMNKKLAGGGVLMDQGVHLIDLVNYFFSSPVVKSVGVCQDLYWNTGVEDNAFAILRNNKKQVALIHVSITQWKPIFCLEIYCEKGYCIINGLGRKYGGEEILIVGKKNKKNEIAESRITCNADAENSLRLELGEFIAAVKNGRQCNPNAGDALNVLRIVNQIYLSE